MWLVQPRKLDNSFCICFVFPFSLASIPSITLWVCFVILEIIILHFLILFNLTRLLLLFHSTNSWLKLTTEQHLPSVFIDVWFDSLTNTHISRWNEDWMSNVERNIMFVYGSCMRTVRCVLSIYGLWHSFNSFSFISYKRLNLKGTK
jgi:hypothetical protein